MSTRFRMTAAIGIATLLGGLMTALAPPAFADTPAGPVAYYRFENDLMDRTGTNNGTAVGAPTFSTSVPTIPASTKSLSLNGSSYVTAGTNASLNITGPITLSAWLNPTSIGSWQEFLSKGDYANGAGAFTYFFAVTPTGHARFGINVGNAGNFVDSAGTVTAGSWNYVAAVFDPAVLLTNTTVYLNGVATTGTITGPVPSRASDALTIGALKNSTGSTLNYFTGLLDEIRMYNRTLGSAEIGALRDYHKFFITLWAWSDSIKIMGTGGATVTARVWPRLSYIPVNFKVVGPNAAASTMNVDTNRAGKASFIDPGTGGGGKDVITAWIDANNDGLLTGTGSNRATDDPRAKVNQYWVDLGVPNYCTPPANETFTDFSVRNDVLYSSVIRIKPTNTTSQLVCIYFANVGADLRLATNPFTVRYTPPGAGAASFVDGWGGTLPIVTSGTDFLGAVIFNGITLFQGKIANAHLRLTFTRGANTYSIPITIHFRA